MGLGVRGLASPHPSWVPLLLPLRQERFWRVRFSSWCSSWWATWSVLASSGCWVANVARVPSSLWSFHKLRGERSRCVSALVCTWLVFLVTMQLALCSCVFVWPTMLRTMAGTYQKDIYAVAGFARPKMLRILVGRPAARCASWPLWTRRTVTSLLVACLAGFAVTLHITLCFFPCRQGQDALHLGRYGSEGLACLPGRQHPCPGAEAFTMVQTCSGQGGRCPCYACVPFDCGRPLFVGFMVGMAAVVVVSAVAWLLLVCWLRCFALCRPVESSQVQFVDTIIGGSTTGVAVQTVHTDWRWTSLCCRSDKFQLSVLTAGIRGSLLRVLYTGTGPGGTRLP